MQDYKAPRQVKTGGNRRKKEKKPRPARDWKGFFRRVLRLTAFAGCTALLVVGGMLGIRLVSESGYFNIDSVRVVNQGRVSEEDLLALSEIKTGTSIFDLNLGMIGRKIEENPWIASARVERVFPREVIIHVGEHQPQAIVSIGYLYYLNAAGEIFKRLEADDSLHYPLITGLDQRTLLEKPAEVRSLLLDALALVGELEKRQIFNLEDVSEIHIDQADGMALYTYSGGVPVLMGLGNFADKLDRLEQIYPELEARLPELKYIDLNVMERVIVKVDNRRATGKG